MGVYHKRSQWDVVGYHLVGQDEGFHFEVFVVELSDHNFEEMGWNGDIVGANDLIPEKRQRLTTS
jgi:hypothetical protein